MWRVFLLGCSDVLDLSKSVSQFLVVHLASPNDLVRASRTPKTMTSCSHYQLLESHSIAIGWRSCWPNGSTDFLCPARQKLGTVLEDSDFFFLFGLGRQVTTGGNEGAHDICGQEAASQQ